MELSSPAEAVKADAASAPEFKAPRVHVLAPLPYAENALEPVISAKTLAAHYGEHHKAYVDNVNRLVGSTPLASLSLPELVRVTARDRTLSPIFNNAAQAWNHEFYWKSLRPPAPPNLSPRLESLIATSFGTLEKLQAQLVAHASAQFGSGWAWLVLARSRLRIMTTGNAHNPLILHVRPLLAIDVWEHAYYLDYRSRRGEYLRALTGSLLNWEFAANNLADA